MEVFFATKYDEKQIELRDAEKLEKLYKCIESGDNFILKWTEGQVPMSKLIIGSDLLSKVKNNDLTLSAKGGE